MVVRAVATEFTEKEQWQRLKDERTDRLAFLHPEGFALRAGQSRRLVHAAGSTYRARRRVGLRGGAAHSRAARSVAGGRSGVAAIDVRPRVLLSGPHRSVAHPHAGQPACYSGPGTASGSRVNTDDENKALYTLRPARFGFTRLDFGIERRNAFGLSTGNAVNRIVRGASLGQFAEALYNRSGLFPNARTQSVYAQIPNVPDAHRFRSVDALLYPRTEVIQSCIEAARAGAPWTEMEPSKRPDIFIPSSHLYHSVDADALTRAGVNGPTSRVQVIDPSALCDIGPDGITPSK